MDAFGVLREIGPESDCAVIFITAFDKHAVHAFDTCAIDYLLKPVAPERLRKAISRAREHLKLKKTIVAPSRSPSQARRFAVRSGQTTTFVGPKEIDWIEADGNYAILHVGSRNHLLRETMAALEGELSPEEFLRVGRSAIVRIEEVKEIRALPNNRHAAVLKNNALVPITRRIREIENKLRLKSKRATD
jgi:two-component system LytT family response regulator